MKNASGLEVTGIFREPGIVPVDCSSEGSRVSMRIFEGEGFLVRDWILGVLGGVFVRDGVWGGYFCEGVVF